jgi:hypothetical protein
MVKFLSLIFTERWEKLFPVFHENMVLFPKQVAIVFMVRVGLYTYQKWRCSRTKFHTTNIPTVTSHFPSLKGPPWNNKQQQSLQLRSIPKPITPPLNQSNKANYQIKMSHVGVCAWLIDGFWIVWLDDWIYWPLIHSTRDYRQYNAIADLHILQFTVTHAQGFSVFTSRILATDFITASLSLQITYEVFFAQSTSLLAISSQSSSTADSLNSISSLSQAHILVGWRLETQLTFLNWNLLYNYFARTKQKT